VTDDEEHGASLLIVCAFFFRPGKLRVCEHNASPKGALPCVIACHSDSAAHPSYPIQWVPYRKRQDLLSDLQNRFSVESEVLVVDPRSLKVTLTRFEKNYSTEDVLACRENGVVTEVDGPVFTVHKVDDVDITPNKVIKTALGHAARADKKSCGAVTATESLENMLELFFHQAQTYRIAVDGGLLRPVEELRTAGIDDAHLTTLGQPRGLGLDPPVSSRSLDPPLSTRSQQPSGAGAPATPTGSSAPSFSPRSRNVGGGGGLSPGGKHVGGGAGWEAIPLAGAAATTREQAASEAARRYNESVSKVLGAGADASHLQLLSFIADRKTR
jgi:hypothetical protein